jgi:hypothetical protein
MLSQFELAESAVCREDATLRTSESLGTGTAAPIAGGGVSLSGTSHPDQGAFRVVEMTDDESIG